MTDQEKLIRLKIVSLAEGELAKHVAEVPPGSNSGPEVLKYGGRPGWEWCCLFVTWLWTQAGAAVGRQASTWALWQIAQKKGWFFPKLSPDPAARLPGNAMLWQYRNSRLQFKRKGHINIIIRPDVKLDHHETIGGNQKNKVSRRIDTEIDADFVGFINPFIISKEGR